MMHTITGAAPSGIELRLSQYCRFHYPHARGHVCRGRDHDCVHVHDRSSAESLRASVHDQACPLSDSTHAANAASIEFSKRV